MKTSMAPSPASSVTPTSEVIPAAKLRKNPWNPNRMTAAMYAKILESLELYGFIDPLLVRKIELDVYEIIDGEHRFTGGCDLGMTEFPCVNLGMIDDAKAKKLTIIANELHGQADPGRMGDLLTDIMKLTSLDDLIVALPYDESVLAGFMGSAAPLPKLEPLPKPAPSTESKEPWAERLFKMPKSVALVVDEAIEKAKDGEEIESWQALERVAADYLAS